MFSLYAGTSSVAQVNDDKCSSALCPDCGVGEDGSQMIGCDGCDSWIHWRCAGITAEPKDDKWFCRACRSHPVTKSREEASVHKKVKAKRSKESETILLQ